MSCTRAQVIGARALADARPPQRAQRAGRARRRACGRRRRGRGDPGAGGLRQRQAPHGNHRQRARHHRVRRFRPPSDRDPHHAGTACARASARARIVVAMEPRSNSMRLGAHADAYRAVARRRRCRGVPASPRTGLGRRRGGRRAAWRGRSGRQCRCLDRRAWSILRSRATTSCSCPTAASKARRAGPWRPSPARRIGRTRAATLSA